MASDISNAILKAIKEKLKIECVHNNSIMELMRGLRSQLSKLITGLGVEDLAPMSLGLSHSPSRFKLKFSPDKVDTMIIQEIGLLDDLDKELNTCNEGTVVVCMAFSRTSKNCARGS